MQRALARLGSDRIYYDYQQRTPSNLKLLEEYLRRLRLWMDRLKMSFERWWQESDLAAAIDPQIRISKEVHQWAFELIEQRPYPYGVDAMTFENMLHWETLKQQRPELIATHNLPDPYEPFILLLKRGGGFFFADDEGAPSYGSDTLHLTTWNLSLLSREIHWLTHDIQNPSSPDTSIVNLDEDTLNAIDASTPKLYGFLPDDNYLFYCGQTPNGDQYLVHDIAGLVIIKFSRDGELIESTEKEHFQSSYEGDIAERYNEHIAAIAAELGTREMQITIQKFFLSQYSFGIKDLSSYEEDFLTDPSTFDEDEHNELEEMIESWLIGDKFVLQLGPHHDFWLNFDGEITDT